MRQSQLFTKTRREAPKDEVAKNAQLLIRGGYIHKEMAGVYVLLPLGLRVFNKIVGIIREEMDAIGGQELVMTALQQKETWEPTNQWSDKEVDVWFKTNLKNGTELGLAVTHEAALTKLMKDFISSHRDLPSYIYQFQTKFRNETRAKSGIMRTREFVMKDLYSFSRNEQEHSVFYEKATQAYCKVFNRVGLGDKTYLTYASGGMFSKYSHEFQTITDAGEDIIYIPKNIYGIGLSGVSPTSAAVNKEIFTSDIKKELGIEGDFEEKKSVEVGNIFTLGTRFSKALGLTFKNEEGATEDVFMGSYGIGPARLMGTIVEVLSDEKGIVWPVSVAPFQIHLLNLSIDDEEVNTLAETLFYELEQKGIEVLYDDRSGVSAGEKFNDSDLLGIPTRIVISKKTLASGMYETKTRKDGVVLMQTKEALLG